MNQLFEMGELTNTNYENIQKNTIISNNDVVIWGRK
jgi:hypothetical protein